MIRIIFLLSYFLFRLYGKEIEPYEANQGYWSIQSVSATGKLGYSAAWWNYKLGLSRDDYYLEDYIDSLIINSTSKTKFSYQTSHKNNMILNCTILQYDDGDKYMPTLDFGEEIDKVYWDKTYRIYQPKISGPQWADLVYVDKSGIIRRYTKPDGSVRIILKSNEDKQESSIYKMPKECK